MQHGCLLRVADGTDLICFEDTPGIVTQALQDVICMCIKVKNKSLDLLAMYSIESRVSYVIGICGTYVWSDHL